MEHLVPILGVILQVVATGFFAIQGLSIGRNIQSNWTSVAIGVGFILACIPLKFLIEPAYPQNEYLIQCLYFWSLFFGLGLLAGIKENVESGKN